MTIDKNPLNLTPQQIIVLSNLNTGALVNRTVEQFVNATPFHMTLSNEGRRTFQLALGEVVRYAQTGKGRIEAMDDLMTVHGFLDPCDMFGQLPEDEESTKPLAVVLIAAARQFAIHSNEPLVEPTDDNAKPDNSVL